MDKFKKKLNQFLGLNLKIKKDNPKTTPVKQEAVALPSTVELMAEQQLKLDHLEFERQVAMGKLMMQQAMLKQAKQKIPTTQFSNSGVKSVVQDMNEERYGQGPFGDVVQARATAQYIALMGYPPENGVLQDQAENFYLIKSVTEQITRTGKDYRDVVMHNVIDATEVPIYFAKDRIEMAIRYQHQSTWPYPEVPAVFIYVNDEERVFMLKAGEGSVFKPVHSWQDISTDGILNAVTNFYRNTAEALQKSYNDPEKNEKFDVFLDAVKLRAEIVEEVKTKLERGEEVVTEFDDESISLPDSEATKRRRKQDAYLINNLRPRNSQPSSLIQKQP